MWFSKKPIKEEPKPTQIIFNTDGSIDIQGDENDITIMAAYLLSGSFHNQLLMALKGKIKNEFLTTLASNITNKSQNAVHSDNVAIPAYKTIQFYYGGNKK